MATAITNYFKAPPATIRGVDTGSWFGPLQPVRPVAPAGTEPRGWQFMPGQNLNFTPRTNLNLTATDLREASTYDMVRVIIENVKDQICRTPINVRLKRLPGETGKDYGQRKPDLKIIADLTALIENPNPSENRSEFMRRVLDDMLVIDAPSVLMRTNAGGKLQELRSVDGATITRYIDANGYTPMAPSPAYAQLWYGIPMVDLTTDQLLYCPRNVPTYRLYGMSPVEQAIHWIMVGTKRLESQLQFYTSGTIPDAIQIVPPGVPPTKIAEAQGWMVSDLAGILSKKHQLRYIQGFAPDGKDQVLFPKDAALADPFDDLVIRCLCFAFGTSPQRLMRMMNRASAEQNDTGAEKEGLDPFKDWAIGSLWNKLIQQKLAQPGYEAFFEEDIETNPVKQAEIDKIRQSVGQVSVNEVRENAGLPTSTLPEADMLMVITATGPVPLSAEEDVKRTAAKTAAMPKTQPFGGGGGPQSPEPKPAEKKTLKIGKAGAITIDVTRLTPESIAARTSIHHALNKCFAKQTTKALAAVRKMVKADDSPDQVANAIYDAVAAEYSSIVDTVAADLQSSGVSGVHHGALQVQLTDTDSIAAANTVASDYAKNRSAELVGMRRAADGRLVPNPNAEWAISDTTRQEIRSMVSTAFDSETPLSTLVERIKTAGAFSDARAQMIAKTEVQNAQSGGNYQAWKVSGVVTKTKWFLSADHTIECVCEDNEDQIVDFGTPFSSGDFFPPAHPRCECTVAAVGFTE